MDCQFREIRKGEREDVLMFAQAHGFEPQGKVLEHHLSLVVLDEKKETLAAALCVRDEGGRFVIEVISGGETVDAALVNELADRCLRKVQAQAIGSTRLHSPSCGSTNAIWSCATWLDKIEEAAPPNEAQPDDEPSQAA